jgi:uncharacterized protein YjbI with pentapeptide repeats
MTDEPQRPTTSEDRAGWKVYWTAQGTAWRTEPEIDMERQRYLTDRRAVQPDIERGIYPFREENSPIALTRADVEWLLATHESGGMRGPVDWDDTSQRKRDGLDLRGADLSGEDLSRLPLARTLGGLLFDSFWPASAKSREMAAVHLDNAILRRASFEYAELRAAVFAGANLFSANLTGAVLTYANLNGADLVQAHLARASLRSASAMGADLRRAVFDVESSLEAAELADNGGVSGRLVDVRWSDVPLTSVDWSRVRVLGDEHMARRRLTHGRPKSAEHRAVEYRHATAANRQLATTLRAQGINDDADRFAYRAQLCQRRLLRLQRHYVRYLGSLFLSLISGYGYRPLRSFVTYVLVVLAFAGAFLLNAQFATPHLRWDEALVLSISAFHGRGFFTSGISLGDTLARLAAGEAIIGLLIEITFIATFTQRFFAR